MRRKAIGGGIMILATATLGACLAGVLAPSERHDPPRLAAVFPGGTPSQTATSTLTPTATPSPTSTPTRTPTVMPSPTATPADLYLTAEDVLVHPGPDVYAGDLVSFEVLAHDGADVGLQQLGVAVYHGDMETGRQLAFARVGVAGVGRRQQATLPWVWDTTGLSGLQTITVALDPDNEYLIGDEDPDNNMVTL
ncbi:MAG: hypothetical protein ACE5FI_10975, partial [Anaerolineales bacterium]